MSAYQVHWPNPNDLDRWTEELPPPWVVREVNKTIEDGVTLQWTAIAERSDSDEVLVGRGRTKREALINLYAAGYDRRSGSASTRESLVVLGILLVFVAALALMLVGQA